MRVDLHQHLWTTPLLEALEQRQRLPFARTRHGLTAIHAAGEPPWTLDPGAMPTDPNDCLVANGLERVAVALSSPLGIEALPRQEAVELIAAHLDGVATASERLLRWGPVPVAEPRADDVNDVLARGCVGISLPAGALGDRGALERLGPLLDRVAAAGVPLFVHPGPAGTELVEEAPSDEFDWWPAVTRYVHQMQEAWFRFVSGGRQRYPDLVVVFAMLAGCAPLHAERLELRSGEKPPLADPLTFYDTSGYGPVAISVMAGLVGDRQLVYGSDRPVVTPPPAERDAALQARAGELLGAAARSR